MLQVVVERSFDWSLAATATVGLAGALIGSVATLAGQWIQGNRELRRHRSGIIKAVLGELRANASVILSSLTDRREDPSEVTAEAWHRSNHDLAQFVPDRTYISLGMIYAMLRPVSKLLDPQGLKEARYIDEELSDLGKWVDEIVTVEEQLLELGYTAGFKEKWARLPNLRTGFDEAIKEMRGTRS